MVIRNLGKNDFEEYYRVRLKSLQEYPVAYSSMPQFFIDATREMHLKLLEDSESDSSFFLKGYFEDGKLLGIIGMKPETRESVAHKASMWGFYVDPEYQGTGIGKKLLEEFLRDAKDDSTLKYVRLMVANSCEKAISLFRSFGFKEYGLETMSISDGNSFYDQLYMKISCE